MPNVPHTVLQVMRPCPAGMLMYANPIILVELCLRSSSEILIESDKYKIRRMADFLCDKSALFPVC